MPRQTVPDDWWPEWLCDLAAEDPLSADRVVVAAIEGTPIEYHRYRHVYTALVPPNRLDTVLKRRGGIGHDVSASGPHPVDNRGVWNYAPRFWVEVGASLPKGLEPLVVSWESNGKTVLWPDQGFLMTYGLVPRLVVGGDVPAMHWDDVATPQTDVVVATAVSAYSFPAHSAASVAVDRD